MQQILLPNCDYKQCLSSLGLRQRYGSALSWVVLLVKGNNPLWVKLDNWTMEVRLTSLERRRIAARLFFCRSGVPKGDSYEVAVSKGNGYCMRTALTFLAVKQENSPRASH